MLEPACRCNLFISKWHTTHRNVAIGDIVWIVDQNALRGQFKLGRVISVNPDSRRKNTDTAKLPCSDHKAIKSKAKFFSIVQSSKVLVQSIVLNRGVRRLVVLLPDQEQKKLIIRRTSFWSCNFNLSSLPSESCDFLFIPRKLSGRCQVKLK